MEARPALEVGRLQSTLLHYSVTSSCDKFTIIMPFYSARRAVFRFAISVEGVDGGESGEAQPTVPILRVTTQISQSVPKDYFCEDQ